MNKKYCTYNSDVYNIINNTRKNSQRFLNIICLKRYLIHRSIECIFLTAATIHCSLSVKIMKEYQIMEKYPIIFKSI